MIKFLLQDKPVVIPDFSNKKDKDYQAPSFVRNVMGSSAGAGSGEFHGKILLYFTLTTIETFSISVYRHLRRKEFARQKHMKSMSEKERLDAEFQEKLEENQRLAEEKTNKKREKRKKKKANKKNKGKKPKLEEKEEESDELSESNDEVEDVQETTETTEETKNEDDNKQESND